MGDFTLPSLPPDFVPNFLTQPNFINNDTNLLEYSEGFNPLQQIDPSREDRFPKDADGDTPFLNELNEALDNLAQTNQDTTLSKEQWIEVAAVTKRNNQGEPLLFPRSQGGTPNWGRGL